MKTEKIKKSLEQFKMIFQRFPITYIATIVLTIFYAVTLERNLLTTTIVKNIYTFGLIFTITSFFIESTFNQKSKKYKIILIIANTLLSFAYVWAKNYINVFLGTNLEKYVQYSQYLKRFIICYTLSITIFSVYSLYKKNDLPINEYLVKTTIAMFKNTLIYGILAIGILLICMAFITLILDDSDYVLIARIQIILFGAFYVPKMFFAIATPEKEVGKFAKVVVKYVLGTLVFSAFAVIYIYIIKILILWRVPSNQIFRITATLFILGCPIWILVSYFKDNDIYQKINSKLPYAFIPFIFMQIYSIGVRIWEYGLTPTRYMGVALIIFEIAYLIIHKLDNEHLRAVFYSLIVIILVSGLAPFINMYKVSQVSQFNILKSNKYSIENDAVADEQVEKARGAYLFLTRTPEGRKLADSILSETEKTILIGYDEDHYKVKYLTRGLFANKELNDLDISGYSKLYRVREYSYNGYLNNLNHFKFV